MLTNKLIYEKVNLNNIDKVLKTSNLTNEKNVTKCLNDGFRNSSELPCTCKHGFTGNTCEIALNVNRMDPCFGNPCFGVSHLNINLNHTMTVVEKKHVDQFIFRHDKSNFHLLINTHF